MGVIVVKSGQLRTYMLSDQGREVTLYRLEPKDTCVMSASCLLKEVTFDVFISSTKDTCVYLININTFRYLTQKYLEVDNYSLQVAVEKFSKVMFSMEQILFLSFDKRLATYLIETSKQLNSSEINETHDIIAKNLGTAREVVTRMLKHFVNEGYITLERKAIKIINVQNLTNYIT